MGKKHEKSVFGLREYSVMFVQCNVSFWAFLLSASLSITGSRGEEIWGQRPSSRSTRRRSSRSTESRSKFSSSSCPRRTAAVEEEEVEVVEEGEGGWGPVEAPTHPVPVATRPLMTAGTRCPFPPRTDPSTPRDSARSPRSDSPQYIHQSHLNDFINK